MRIPAIGKSISITALLAEIAATLEHPGDGDAACQPVNAKSRIFQRHKSPQTNVSWLGMDHA